MKTIIKKYLEGQLLSQNEQMDLLDWFRTGNLNTFEDIKVGWKKEIANQEFPRELHDDLLTLQFKMLQSENQNRQKTEFGRKIFQYVAIFLALVSFSGLLYYMTNGYVPAYDTVVQAENGQISKIILPDSTMVWLNSGSTLKYNSHFKMKNRELELLGEGYFKVAHHDKHPFTVKTSDIFIEVTGTEFSVGAYPEDAKINVVLEKGAVELSLTGTGKLTHRLVPGEMASFDKNRRELAIEKVNTSLYTSWKDGIINIHNMPLREIVQKLEKRYNQRFIVDDRVAGFHYTFTIENEKLEDVINLLKVIAPVSISYKNEIIHLQYNGQKGEKHKE